MDAKRLFIATALSMLILWGYGQMYPSPQPNTAATATAQQAQVQAASPLGATSPITVNTDTVQAVIDEKTGDLRGMTLNQYNSAAGKAKKLLFFHNSTTAK